ncbi:hypothetical protein [Acetobacter sp. P5B1]|uniref:hypothetical protein n=1 Tax=Acetobacter sp. P5B1 TaxID=2762620 RepID=UPI001C0590BC|nr:hypothetical protein [Acetobacter sp. P5B1]
MSKHLHIAIARCPKCPACQQEYVDDWHHSIRRTVGFVAEGSDKCANCGKFYAFDVYPGGEVHSTMWRKSA